MLLNQVKTVATALPYYNHDDSQHLWHTSYMLEIILSNFLCMLIQSSNNPCSFKYTYSGFPGGAVVRNPPANAGDTGSSPGPGRSHMPCSN